MTVQRGNLLDGAQPPTQGERFDVLARLGACWIEHIVSSATPSAERYDQAQDEWVLLLAGEATLEVAGESVSLSAGDHVLLPAHTPHRVTHTSHGARWLAVHHLAGTRVAQNSSTSPAPSDC